MLGESFVTLAFQAARAADPTAKLYINDFKYVPTLRIRLIFYPFLLFSLDSANAKLTALVNLVKKINESGTKLIDGIGSQMHLSAEGTGGVEAALQLAATAGVEVAITGILPSNPPCISDSKVLTGVVDFCLELDIAGAVSCNNSQLFVRYH